MARITIEDCLDKVINFTNHHPRVNILRPSCGVGGHCIALDPWFLVSQFPEDTNIIHMSRKVNIYKTEWTIKKIYNESNITKPILMINQISKPIKLPINKPVNQTINKDGVAM